MIGILLLGVDQATKAWANAQLPSGREVTIVNHWLWFRLTHNSGVALGLFSGNNALVGGISLGIVVALAVLAFQSGAGGRAGAIGIGLVAGGAISNLVDRVRLGAVTDFIEVHAWPTDFNLGDAAVRFGVLLFLLSLLVRALRRRRTASAG